MSDLYLIFSVEHGMWWGPDRSGYTPRLSEAGRYSRRDALLICCDAMPGTAGRLGMLPELPVRETDVVTMQTAFAACFPGRVEAWQ